MASIIAPWQPIAVSPLSVARFVSGRATAVLSGDFRWIMLPSLLLFAVGCFATHSPAGRRSQAPPPLIDEAAMRTEAFGFFAYGVALALLALAVTWRVSPPLLRLHLRAPFIALGLGVMVIPGHGEFIVVPLLGVSQPPIHAELIAIGGFFFLAWWLVAVLALLALRAVARSRC